jgi:hypothetical protein
MARARGPPPEATIDSSYADEDRRRLPPRVYDGAAFLYLIDRDRSFTVPIRFASGQTTTGRADGR